MENMTQGFEGEGFAVTPEIIIENRELVTDFFGDNRSWYESLKNGGQTYGRTFLDSQEDFNVDGNGDDMDLPPLEPAKITQERAKSIAAFLKETPDAQMAFAVYMDHSKESLVQ